VNKINWEKSTVKNRKEIRLGRGKEISRRREAAIRPEPQYPIVGFYFLFYPWYWGYALGANRWNFAGLCFFDHSGLSIGPC